ncbi:MAG TPA: hypothetical protein VIJ85_13505 [Rhizomicrobium sp.]
MRLFSSVAVIAIALSSAVMAADAPAPAMKPSLLRGTVDSFDGKTLAIKTDAGAVVSLPVTAMTHFAVVAKRSFSQLKTTDFIGVTSVPGKDGHLRAEEIHTIPLAGLGEGQYPWDHHPKTAAPSAMMGSMTNGTVTSAGAMQLNVSYHGAGMVDGKCEGLAVPGKPGCTGVAVVDVTPATSIVAILPGLHEDVKPGLAVAAGIMTDPAGHQFLTSATVEKNGVKPEF